MQTTSTQVTVAQALARAFHRAGVRRMFGLPGGGSSLDLIDAAAALGIEFVLARTETAAVMMAGALAETSGVPGVAITTKGPGLANAVNGVAYASLDRAPVIVVTDGFTATQSTYVTHQVFDQRAMLAPVTKAHSRLDGADVVGDIDRLIALACEAPCGPVHVELTGEAARRRVDPGIDVALPQSVSPIDSAALIRLHDRIASARRPVVVIGLEARRHGPEVRRLVATLGCPVLATYKAKGVVPDADPQVVGLFTGGSQEEECIAAADLMVLVGVDPVEMILQKWRYGKPVVEMAAAHHAVHYCVPEVRVIGALGEIVAAVEERLRHRPSGWRFEETTQLAAHMRERLAYGPVAHGVAPDRIVQMAASACAVRGLAPRMSVDAGAHMFSATAFFPSAQPGDTLISNGLATMGFALPAAIAAALDDRSRPVVCFTGDGGLMMCLGELCTAVEMRARIVVVVFNDAALSLIDIKQQSRELAPLGVRWKAPDFAATMRALGGQGFAVEDEASYVQALNAALGGQGPCVIDVSVDPKGYAQQLKAMRG